jgi:ubiquinol-cytochrome c reductase iron-sulfur subunit
MDGLGERPAAQFRRIADCRSPLPARARRVQACLEILPAEDAMTDMLLEPPLGRRDFLLVASGALAATAAASVSWPLIRQMEPSAGVLAAGAPISFDLSHILPGQQIVVLWRAMPVFIVRRSAAILQALKDGALLARLRDPASQERQQPPYAANWSRALNPEYLVLVGVCTHLGCIPAFQGNAALSAGADGYLCHCHGSRYDLAGRVFKGVPAPYNLPVPPHHFPDGKTLVIGENPAGAVFDLADVRQI